MHSYEGKDEVPQKTKGDEIKSRNGRLIFDRRGTFYPQPGEGRKECENRCEWFCRFGGRKTRNSLLISVFPPVKCHQVRVVRMGREYGRFRGYNRRCSMD